MLRAVFYSNKFVCLEFNSICVMADESAWRRACKQ